MQKISPLLQQRIINQQNTASKAQVQTPVDLSQKPDTVELSNKETETKPNKKKIAKYAAIAFTAAAATAAIVAIIKGKTPADILKLQKSADAMADEANKVLSNAQEMQKEAQNLADEANKAMGEVQAKYEKIKEEVISLFNNEGKKDGIQVATIEKTDNSSTMKEFGSDGVLVRKSEFRGSKLYSIEEITQNGTNMYETYGLASQMEYIEGYKALPDGTAKYAKKIYFDKDGFSSYHEDCELLPDGTKKSAKIMGFKDGKLTEYIKKYECLPDGTKKSAKSASFENGKLIGYAEGFERSTGGTAKYAKEARFENGELTEYTKSIEFLPDGTEKWAKSAIFENGKLAEYNEGTELLPDGTEKWAKRIEKNEKGKWVEVEEN